MYQVLIADDHPVVRTGLVSFLKDEPHVTAIGEVASGVETLQQLAHRVWHLLIFDLHLRDVPGLELLSQARATGIRVLVVGAAPEEHLALNLLQAGAHGYVSKATSAENLRLAVRTVLAGRTYLSEKMAGSMRLMVGTPMVPGRPLHARLSPREFHIMCRLARGGRQSDVARELDLSVKTVSTHRTRLLEKMALNSNSDITAYALRHHLIE